MNNKIFRGMFWKLLERFGVFGIQFLLQIVLARILDPSYYGMLTIMTIFTTLANVFVQTGFNTSLIQNKDVTDEDYSSVFWVSLLVAVVLYVGLYFAAPAIGGFYKSPQIVAPFRVLCLMLIPCAFNSVQLAKLSREMNFHKVFLSNIVGVIISGIAGIACAYAGLGLWALVVQSLSNVVVACIVMLVTVKWRPRFVCNLRRVGVLFSFGWKLLVSGLLDTLYSDLTSLIVGKKYDTGTLGYYHRGMQFPQVLANPITGALQSVLLPAMSQKQDSREQVKALTRRTVTLGSYIIFPLMAGLAGVANSLVSLLLTDKWLPCVPYLQVFCVSFAFYHVHSANLQAINAMGRSDVFLKLEIMKKTVGLSFIAIGLFCFETPLAIAVATTATTPIGLLINAYPNKKLIGYSFSEQVRDILPALLLSLGMLAAVFAVELLQMNTLLTLIVQVAVGVCVYVALSALFRIADFRYLLDLIKNFLHNPAKH